MLPPHVSPFSENNAATRESPPAGNVDNHASSARRTAPKERPKMRSIFEYWRQQRSVTFTGAVQRLPPFFARLNQERNSEAEGAALYERGAALR